MDSHDNENLNYIENIIDSNWVVIDIGSCDGNYVEWFNKKIDKSGKIISIELHPENYQKIKQNFLNNENVEVLNYAVSEIDGEIDYYVGEARWLHNIIGCDVNGKECLPAGKIESITLNTLLENYEKIDLIKIDVEGAELSILKGMNKVYNKVNNLIVECHNQKDWEELKKILIIDYKFECFNNSSNVENKPKINIDSDLAYQCVCKNK
jgi:FkbM family methyltransferase